MDITVHVIAYKIMFGYSHGASPVAETVKNPPAMPKTRVQSLSHEEPLEVGMATHCSILAWRMP